MDTVFQLSDIMGFLGIFIPKFAKDSNSKGFMCMKGGRNNSRTQIPVERNHTFCGCARL